MLKCGMFVYPWDIVENSRVFIDKYSDAGCNMIAVNAVYHQCNVLDTSLRHVYERPIAGTSFAFHSEKYGRLHPYVQADLTKTYMELREQCQRKDIDWRCWMVNLHNDQIGNAFPDTTVCNVWGDHYPSALCVNHPDVQEYACAVLTDVLETLAPSRVIMESECWMQAFHGRHHEFALARVTPAIRYLLSLCFCPHCIQAAQEVGIDVLAVKNTTLLLLDQLLQGDTTFGSNENTQLLQIFLEYPLLYAFQRFRMHSVDILVQKTTAIAHSYHALYEYIPSAAPFEINTMQYDGTAFAALGQIVDGFVPLCYSPNETYPLLRRNIHLFSPNARVSMALNLERARYPGASVFLDKVQEAVKDGAEDIYCYNYGLATAECLGWMQKAYQSF